MLHCKIEIITVGLFHLDCQVWNSKKQLRSVVMQRNTLQATQRTLLLALQPCILQRIEFFTSLISGRCFAAAVRCGVEGISTVRRRLVGGEFSSSDVSPLLWTASSSTAAKYVCATSSLNERNWWTSLRGIFSTFLSVSYTHLTLPTIYSV